MGALGEKQGKLGEQQGELGRQQGELAEQANRQMKQLLDEAITKGTAQPRNLTAVLRFLRSVILTEPLFRRTKSSALECPLACGPRKEMKIPGAPFLARSLREKWGFSTERSRRDLAHLHPTACFFVGYLAIK